jgi:hypothetical protein
MAKSALHGGKGKAKAAQDRLAADEEAAAAKAAEAAEARKAAAAASSSAPAPAPAPAAQKEAAGAGAGAGGRGGGGSDALARRSTRHGNAWAAMNERKSVGAEPMTRKSVRKKHVSTYEGFVKKRKGYLSFLWDRRYFILNHHILLYGADRPNATNEHNLKGATVTLSEDKSHIIVEHLIEAGKKTIFCAEKGEDDEFLSIGDLNERWVHALKEGLQPPKKKEPGMADASANAEYEELEHAAAQQEYDEYYGGADGASHGEYAEGYDEHGGYVFCYVFFLPSLLPSFLFLFVMVSLPLSRSITACLHSLTPHGTSLTIINQSITYNTGTTTSTAVTRMHRGSTTSPAPRTESSCCCWGLLLPPGWGYRGL